MKTLSWLLLAAIVGCLCLAICRESRGRAEPKPPERVYLYKELSYPFDVTRFQEKLPPGWTIHAITAHKSGEIGRTFTVFYSRPRDKEYEREREMELSRPLRW